VQMLEQPVGDLVGPGRAARTAVLPARVEHEVPDDELAASAEQVEQAGLAVWARKDVVLVDLDHGEPAALGVQRVSPPRELLLLGQKPLAGDQPLVSCHDVGKAHADLLELPAFGLSMCGPRGEAELIGPAGSVDSPSSAARLRRHGLRQSKAPKDLGTHQLRRLPEARVTQGARNPVTASICAPRRVRTSRTAAS